MPEVPTPSPAGGIVARMACRDRKAPPAAVPPPYPAFDRVLRGLVAVPKSKVDAARRKAPERKPALRKRKGK
jgi:hypothetical protein